jgi:Tfp pilus assembly protein PilZ
MTHPVPRRRFHPRALLPATALVFTRSRVFGPCLVQNISVGGVHVQVDQALRRGQRVRVLLDLPWLSRCALAGEVCRSERAGTSSHVVGICFAALPAPLREKLETLIAEQLLAAMPSIEFFETEGGGRRKQLVLAESPLLVADRQLLPL